MNRRQANAESMLEIFAADVAETAHGLKVLTDSLDALGVELTLVSKDCPIDEDGLFVPELLDAANATDWAMTELELISRG